MKKTIEPALPAFASYLDFSAEIDSLEGDGPEESIKPFMPSVSYMELPKLKVKQKIKVKKAIHGLANLLNSAKKIKH